MLLLRLNFCSWLKKRDPILKCNLLYFSSSCLNYSLLLPYRWTNLLVNANKVSFVHHSTPAKISSINQQSGKHKPLIHNKRCKKIMESDCRSVQLKCSRSFECKQKNCIFSLNLQPESQRHYNIGLHPHVVIDPPYGSRTPNRPRIVTKYSKSPTIERFVADLAANEQSDLTTDTLEGKDGSLVGTQHPHSYNVTNHRLNPSPAINNLKPTTLPSITDSRFSFSLIINNSFVH